MFKNRLFYITLGIILILFIWAVLPDNEGDSSGNQSNMDNFDFTMYSKGDPNAPVKLVQYSDFLCPSCAQISLSVMPEIEKNYVDTGQVYFTFKVLNLGFNPVHSQKLAEASVCAADQNKFWEYHDSAYMYVYSNFLSRGVDPHNIVIDDTTPLKLGQELGVDSETFNQCVLNHDKKQDIDTLTAVAKRDGVSGTPYFKVNETDLGGVVPDYNMLEKTIKANL